MNYIVVCHLSEKMQCSFMQRTLIKIKMEIYLKSTKQSMCDNTR